MFAKQHWPGEDPLGKRIEVPADKMSGVVVGVVGDAKHFQLNEAQRPQLYYAMAQNPFIFAVLTVRTKVEPMSLADDVRAAVWSIDKDQPVWRVRSMEMALTNNIASPKFVMTLMTGFAALALLLTALGLYGVMAYVVSQRTHEIGIRMALGAQRGDVLRLVLRQGMVLALIGVGLGLAAALAATRAMQSLLFGVTANDPMTFVAVALVLTLVALLACYVPARRATKVDPMVALRYE
jgi:putative ABC transport system permease protein